MNVQSVIRSAVKVTDAAPPVAEPPKMVPPSPPRATFSANVVPEMVAVRPVPELFRASPPAWASPPAPLTGVSPPSAWLPRRVEPVSTSAGPLY
jgi:hypothetical protein